jgi:hypothetical protein
MDVPITCEFSPGISPAKFELSFSITGEQATALLNRFDPENSSPLPCILCQDVLKEVAEAGDDAEKKCDRCQLAIAMAAVLPDEWREMSTWSDFRCSIIRPLEKAIRACDESEKLCALSPSNEYRKSVTKELRDAKKIIFSMLQEAIKAANAAA